MNAQVKTQRLHLPRLALFIFGLWVLFGVAPARAQTCAPAQEGYNAVWQTCNGQTQVVGSPAFIDASAWCNGTCNQPDICQFIDNAVAQLPAGAVLCGCARIQVLRSGLL